ncbi:HNH endonuclease [Clostridium botulinum]|uniref:HNH endonuclease n=1 Tax=Clostridium botulinum TaxID=1491 RepID=UPI0019685C51
MKAYSAEPFVTEIRDKTDWDDANLNSHRRLIKSYLKKICNCKCYFCGSSITGADITIEHIISKTKYKAFTYKPENLILCCKECNTLKSEYYVLNKKYNGDEFNSWNDYPDNSCEYKIIHPYFDKYEDHLMRVGVIYECIGESSKGLNTIEAFRLDRLTLAERNASIDNDKGILFEILRDTEIDFNKTKQIMDEYFRREQEMYSEPKFTQFDEFVNMKLHGSQSFPKKVINEIYDINENILKNFSYCHNQYLEVGNTNEISSDKLSDGIKILQIIDGVLRAKHNFTTIKCLCDYNLKEIQLYWEHEKFKKDKNNQVMFAIKLLNILKIIENMNIKDKGEELIKEIKEEIKCAIEEKNKRSA